VLQDTVSNSREQVLIQGIIFDIDGVVVDSEQLHEIVLKEAITDFDNSFDVQIDDRCIGLSLEKTLDHVGIDPLVADQIKTHCEEIYVRRINSDYVRPGVKTIVENLLSVDYKIGFVSSASKTVCTANLQCLDIRSSFPVISCDDVEKTKPHPHPYRQMLSILKLQPNEVMVVEDSDTGIRSAYSAGIRHICAWPHSMSGSQSYYQASAIIEEIDTLMIYLGDGE